MRSSQAEGTGTGDIQKGTGLHELLDRFVDAQRLDIKAYSSSHISESKLYCSPGLTQHSSWSGQNRSPVMLQTVPRPGINANSQNKVKKDAVVKPTDDAQMKQHYRLKWLKPPYFPKLAMTVDSKHVASSATSNQIFSTSESQDVCCTDCVLVDELCLPVQMNSIQENVRVFDAAGNAASQLPVTGTFLPSVVPTHLKAATKKEQFRKMRDYHNNVIQHPSYVRRHALTGSDAVKYLERHLHEV